MKKLLMVSVLGVTVAVSTAFGQGYMTFGARSRTVWDYSEPLIGPPYSLSSDYTATFMWAPSTITSSLVDSIAPSTPTNLTSFAYLGGAWSDIEASTSEGWTFATTGGANVYGVPGSNNGSFAYDSLNSFPLDNAGPPGTTISMFVVAWDTDGGLYTTLGAAEAADVLPGWSSVFDYTLGGGPPATPPAETSVSPFGIEPGPEPTTLALVGFGGISMILLRHSRRRT